MRHEYTHQVLKRDHNNPADWFQESKHWKETKRKRKILTANGSLSLRLVTLHSEKGFIPADTWHVQSSCNTVPNDSVIRRENICKNCFLPDDFASMKFCATYVAP